MANSEIPERPVSITHTPHITTLLQKFGVKIPKGRRQNFVFSNSGKLEYIYYDAKQEYLKQIKSTNPKTVDELNLIWNWVNYWFRRRCPSIEIFEPIANKNNE